MDQLGNLEFDDLDNVVKFADTLAAKLAVKTTRRLKGVLNKSKDNYKKEKAVIKEKFVKKKRVLQKYIKSAPFTRLSDKLTFVTGVMMITT